MWTPSSKILLIIFFSYVPLLECHATSIHRYRPLCLCRLVAENIITVWFLESNLKILHLEKQHYCHTRCVYKHNILCYLFPPSHMVFQSTRETPLGETRQTCAAQFPCPGWELPSPAFLPTSPTGCFRWVQTVQPHQHSITHASPTCCSPAPAEPHHGGSTWPGNRAKLNQGWEKMSLTQLSWLSVLFYQTHSSATCRCNLKR